MVSKICRSECDSATGDWQCAHNLIWVRGSRVDGVVGAVLRADLCGVV